MLQHLMLACERRDLFGCDPTFVYHEIMSPIAEATTGIAYHGFNCLAEYEQRLADLGFPDLLPPFVAGDFDGLHRACQLFDQRLRDFLGERAVPLNVFSGVDELKRFLALPAADRG
jgi:hypothetical protein